MTLLFMVNIKLEKNENYTQSEAEGVSNSERKYMPNVMRGRAFAFSFRRLLFALRKVHWPYNAYWN